MERLVMNGFEREEYLSQQIITYLGNKRSLLGFIGNAVQIVKKELDKKKLDILDVFSGSGVVSRYFKQFSKTLYSNDIEDYCYTINSCYLANESDISRAVLRETLERLKWEISQKRIEDGFIYSLYAPENDRCIQQGERVFYTTRNAQYIDTARVLIEKLQEPYKTLLLAPLLYEASVHNNTSGVFKGFYKNSKTGIGQYGGDGKNALKRIMADIEIKEPVFSAFDCDVRVLKQDANTLYKTVDQVDLAYIDPPYNQHPYGSNYFMLNLINSYKEPSSVSKVSGIPSDWNKSQYNSRQTSKQALRDLCENINAKYLLISFNSEGFISLSEMIDMLSEIGRVTVLETPYNTFRGSRNLDNRNIHVTEYLYLVNKG